MSDAQGSDPRPAAELLSEFGGQLSTLVRQEIELARVEMRREVVTTAKASGALVVAAVGGLFTLVFGSSAAAWGLAQVVATGWAFLTVALLWLVVASVASVAGVKKLRRVQGPTQTVESVKEDVAWAKSRKS